jgi:thymidylate synthase
MTLHEDINDGRIPSFHIVAKSIPEAFFKAMDAVWHHGMSIRTQYDRKEQNGIYIDPPSRDARVLIEIVNPFAQPRYPKVSFCEIGKYIAEIMGVKDHLVVPMADLREGIRTGNLPKEWPYTYHQRLFSYPLWDGGTVNQVAKMVERIAESSITRRAVATTRVPEIDSYLIEDLPCLGEVQIRCPEDKDGNLVLNMDTRWRSRDLYKAWCDNVVALTFMQQILAREIEERTGRPVRVGSYADYSTSLHIYGQDFRQISGNSEKGIKDFFERFDATSFMGSSLNSERVREFLILPQLEELAREEDQWRFTPESKAILEDLIDGLRQGRYIA